MPHVPALCFTLNFKLPKFFTHSYNSKIRYICTQAWDLKVMQSTNLAELYFLSQLGFEALIDVIMWYYVKPVRPQRKGITYAFMCRFKFIIFNFLKFVCLNFVYPTVITTFAGIMATAVTWITWTVCYIRTHSLNILF